MHKYLALAQQIFLTAIVLLAVSFTNNFVTVAQETRALQAKSTQSRSASDSLSAKDRVETFEEVWKTINEKYYDPAFNGVKWNAVREQYRPRVEAATSDTEVYRVLSQMAQELHDSHTRVLSPRQAQQRRRRQATSTGILIYEVEGEPVIFSVTPDSEAAQAGVTAGMRVRTVDGKPIDEAVAEARREIGTSSSERATKLLSYSRIVRGEPDAPLKLGLTRADGTPFEVTLARRTISTAPKLTARLLPSGIAYIKFNRFQPPIGKEMKAALEKFKDAPGLILDLRSNGGGDGEEGLRIGSYFFDTRVSIARIVTRTGKPPSFLFGLVKLPKEFQAGRKGGQIYANPVVVLINEATGSTSELFASAMQEHGRAQIVGTQSCGCVLGVLDHRKLKGGGELTVSEISFITSRGRTLEGNGVMPDKSVAITLADLARGRDVALEEAEKLLGDSSRGITQKAQ